MILKNNKIVLIGMMGCGKSTIAKYISESTDLISFDLDSFIEEKTGNKIKTIFKEKGEIEFRKLEQIYLIDLIALSPDIISTGGGIIENQENIVLLKNAGYLIIYIKNSFEELALRLKNQRKDRPLLNDGDWKKSLNRMLDKRNVLYSNAADFIVENDNRELNAVVDYIISKIIYSK